jgi:hypothetical protein
MTLDASGVPIRQRVITKLFSNPSVNDRDAEWAMLTRQVQLASAHSFGLLTVADPKDRLQAVKAGMAWQRMHLSGTVQNVAMQPMTQTIDCAQRELATAAANAPFSTALRGLAGGAGEPIFAFRLGHAKDVALPSPRRGVDQVIYKQLAAPEPPPTPKAKKT